MKLRNLSPLLVLLLVISAVLPEQQPVRAEGAASPPGSKGGVILYTVPPQTVCVGDTFTIEGGSFVYEPDIPPSEPGGIPLAPLLVIHLAVTTALGSAAPSDIVESTQGCRKRQPGLRSTALQGGGVLHLRCFPGDGPGFHHHGG